MHIDRLSASKTRRFCALLIGTACVLLFQSAHATLLKYDAFNYTDNEGIGYGSSAANWNVGNSTGTGAWTNRTSAALSYSGLATSSGIGVRVNVSPSSNRDRGTQFSATIGPDNPNVYCSFLMNVASAPNGNKLVAYFRSNTSAGTPAVGIWLDSNMRLGISKGTTSATLIGYMSGSVSLNTTNFIVARYHYVDGNDNPGDSVALWLNPHLGTFTAPEAFIPPPTVSTNYGSSQTTIQSFMLANRAAGNGAALADISLDELRIGTTWADVTPAVHGIAAKLAFTVQPTNCAMNMTMSPVVVQVQDSYGTNISQSGLPVIVSLFAGYGALSGTLTNNTDATGKATFSDLRINHVDAVAVLSATASNLFPATSDLFAVGIGSAPKSPVVTQTAAASSGIILRGTNGDAGQSFTVLTSTNLGTPLSSWSPAGSFNFDGSGNFACTNAISPSDPMKFYCVKPTGSGSSVSGIEGLNGFASVDGVTGGAGGPVRIIDDLSAFTAYGQSVDPVIMLIRSNLTYGTSSSDSSFYLGPNKTIIGLGTNVTLTGDLAIYGTYNNTEVSTACTNTILRNLVFSNPSAAGEGDGLTIKNGARGVWVDHCTFFDCDDGELDVTEQSDFVTVSWCKFFYTVPNFNSHPNVNLIGADDTHTGDIGTLHVTFHHNWWSSNCLERMPSIRFGRVHVYNNYFNCTSNHYCTRARLYSEVLVENNYYDNVYNPWELATSSKGPDGLLRCTGNITNNCTFSTNHYNPNLPNSGILILVPGTNTLSTGVNQLNPPPYSYTLDAAADIPNSVTNSTGAGKGPFTP